MAVDTLSGKEVVRPRRILPHPAVLLRKLLVRQPDLRLGQPRLRYTQGAGDAAAGLQVRRLPRLNPLNCAMGDAGFGGECLL
jgi:hypothetical protein